MIRLATLVWLLVAGGMIGGLFQLKYEVQRLERNLAVVERENAREREAIRVLRAEWSYLNRPQRIRRLARKYLDLSPTHRNRLYRLREVPASLVGQRAEWVPSNLRSAVLAPPGRHRGEHR